MAEKEDVKTIIDLLKEKEEMDADKHDGCYELMRETVKAYSRIQDYSVLDFKDLDLLYHTTIGTWARSIDNKKKEVIGSHLNTNDKEHISSLLDSIWERAQEGYYTNYEESVNGPSIGLFGLGIATLKSVKPFDIQSFIKMCVDILPMNDDNAIFDRAELTLVKPFKGMQAASASMILHCLKPYTFPILNSKGNVYEKLGVNLTKSSKIETLIDNCRIIKDFRDTNFKFKNYRIFDIMPWTINGNSEHSIGKIASWEVINDDIARKLCDKSFFSYRGSAIPVKVLWFFKADSLNTGEKKEVSLVYDGIEYKARIQKTNNDANQTRIFWDPVLAEKFKRFENDGIKHILEFNRNGENRYKIFFTKKVWLLTWNKDKWHWDGYAEKCDATAAGGTVTENWECTSTFPKIDDEVFLIKLGEQPRGILGHGRVIKESYKTEHYDTKKTAEGKMSPHIDVEFDRLLNYEKDRILSQDVLNVRCSSQYWSPRNSGIEIKEDLPTLYALWNAVSNNQEEYGFADIISFLSDYEGVRYIAPDKAGDKAEFMIELKHRGQEAREKFKSFGQKVASQIPRLEYVSCSNWLNQSQVVQDYLWIEMKKTEWHDYPQSVSLSIEKHGDKYPGEGYFISVRAASNDNDSSSADNQRQFKLLDCDLIESMTYRAMHNDKHYYFHGRDTEQINALREEGTIMKVEVVESIEELQQKDTDRTLLEETVKAAKEIQPLYEYVMQKEEWWPSLLEYDPGLTAEQYHDLLLNENVVKNAWLQALYELYQMPDHLGTCKQMGEKYGYDPQHYNRYLSLAAENVAKETKCILLPREEENSKYWPVLFQGKYTTDKSQGVYCWKMREPVVIAMERLISEDRFEAKYRTDFDHNTILYGPPGTGKTYNSVIYAVAMCEDKDVSVIQKMPYDEVLSKYRQLKNDGLIEFITFHQSYGYEEFIEGIKPRIDSDTESLRYVIEEGIFKQFCNKAKIVNPFKRHVFIIDEINRGNISKIFGELITLIEDTKRDGASEAMEVKLPYSGESFSIPKNVYILGTMNTADRSIALMDTALRRRFRFIEMMPDSNVLRDLEVTVNGVTLNIQRMFNVINERIECLFDRDHKIGHALFTKLKGDPSLDTLAGIFEKDVIPLLLEYFYDDFEKIQLVLGDNGKDEEYKFILDKKLDIKTMFNGNPGIDLDIDLDKGFEIQHEAFYKLESYKRIGKDL